MIFRSIILFLFIAIQIPLVQSQEMAWWKETVVYQIYPRSFCDTDGDGIGDLNGVISKLDYLQELGVETIWISPFFESPQQDFGYDISDYYKIDPLFGNSIIVNQLINEIHQRDMYIVFDLVMNHTSVDHAWFVESAKDSVNPKADWYVWRTGKKINKRPPNNWKSTIGGSGWHYHDGRKQWYFSSFLPWQPDLNYHHPETKEAMLDVARYWLDQGVDGFRLDIFNVIYQDLSYEDNPFSFRVVPSAENPDGFFQKMKYTVNHSLNYDFAKELRAVLDSYDDRQRFAVGEVFGDDASIKKYLGEKSDGLNLVFQFDMLAFEFNAKFFADKINSYNHHYSDPYFPTLVFSNHDRKRSISRVENDVDKAKLIATFQLTARGVPFIYQGEEIGMTQAKIPTKNALDPLALKYKWMPQVLVNMSKESLNRDECRTPMQWDNKLNAGFSTAETTWLPVNENYSEINVENALADSNSLLKVFQDLLQIRNQYKTLQSGSIELIPTQKNSKILAYRRSNNDETIDVILNFSSQPISIDYDVEASTIIYSLHPENNLQDNELSIHGLSAMIIKCM